MTGCYSSWQSWPTHRDGTYVNIYPSLLNLNIDQPEQTHGWRCWDACVSVCQMTLSIFMADIKWKHKQIDFKCHSCLCQSLLLQLTKLCLIGLDLGPFCSHATQLWKTFNKSACCGAAGDFILIFCCVILMRERHMTEWQRVSHQTCQLDNKQQLCSWFYSTQCFNLAAGLDTPNIYSNSSSLFRTRWFSDSHLYSLESTY